MTNAQSLPEFVKAEALAHGFDAVGITGVDLPKNNSIDLQAFLRQGLHGEMEWLEDRSEKRSAPSKLWPDAKSILVVGANYGPDDDPLKAVKNAEVGAISIYAQNRDYHDILKKRLKQLARKILTRTGGELKVFVDTAPVMEKPLATMAGLGWQGKHTNLVSQEFGSWLFLGVMYLSVALEPDENTTDKCGTCARCIRACPTDAFLGPYQLDARKCISYLTIENKGPIPEEFRAAIGNRIYGCDDCLAVCPWNKFAKRSKTEAFHPREDLKAPLLEELCVLDDAAFRAYFTKSPVKRIGRDRFLRNVLIAIGNSRNANLLNCVTERLEDKSALVRGAAIWAFGRLATTDHFNSLKQRALVVESNQDVVTEWKNAPHTNNH